MENNQKFCIDCRYVKTTQGRDRYRAAYDTYWCTRFPVTNPVTGSVSLLQRCEDIRTNDSCNGNPLMWAPK